MNQNKALVNGGRLRSPDESKLPKWARNLISNLRAEVDMAKQERDRMAVASDVLNNRDWFTLQTHGDKQRSFFVLRHDEATKVCTLYGNDILVIGRERST